MEVRLLAWSARGTIGATASSDVGLAPNDWLHPPPFHGVVERDSAKHVSMISHGAR